MGLEIKEKVFSQMCFGFSWTENIWKKKVEVFAKPYAVVFAQPFSKSIKFPRGSPLSPCGLSCHLCPDTL